MDISQQFFNGIDAIIHSTHSYEVVKPKAKNPDMLFESYKMIVNSIVSGNPALTGFRDKSSSIDSIDERDMRNCLRLTLPLSAILQKSVVITTIVLPRYL